MEGAQSDGQNAERVLVEAHGGRAHVILDLVRQVQHLLTALAQNDFLMLGIVHNEILTAVMFDGVDITYDYVFVFH